MTSYIARLAVVLLAVVLFAACDAPSNDSGSGTDGAALDSATNPPTSTVRTVGPTVPTDTTTAVTPTEGAIRDIVGYDIQAVYDAVDEMRFQYVVSCMVADGWDFDRSMLPTLPPQPSGGSSEGGLLAGEQGELAIRLVESMESGRNPDQVPSVSSTVALGGSESPERDAAVATCFDIAATEVPNPLEPFQEWLFEEQESIQELTVADPRVVQAHDDERQCVIATGYPFESVDEANQHFEELVDPIVENYRAGVLTAQDAVTELSPIAAEGRAVGEAITPCIMERLRVTGMVRAEYEEAWLDENADRVAAAANEMVLNLEPLKEALDSK